MRKWAGSMRYNRAMPAANTEIWTVSQVTRRVKSLVEEHLGSLWLSGEISNWKIAASGHAYFTLKDENSQIDAVMFKGNLRKVRFDLENGLEVLAHGRLTVYERRGNYQIVLDEMEPRGVGALQLAFEQLKKKLDAEGLFDEARKKPLPMLPRRIGVVTSPTGAAIRDILNVLERRFAGVHVLIYPARVQGKVAATEIVAGIRALDARGVDVMIVGRGGGSLEDLWPFNEEPVVRAVFEARTPVISAVGHEVDVALTDFAADLRAPTPSAAAELVVRERQALIDRVRQERRRLEGALRQTLERLRYRLSAASRSFLLQRPEELLRQPRQACDELCMRLEGAMGDAVRQARQRVDGASRTLALLSPANQLRQARERLAATRERAARAARGMTERLRARLRPAAAQLNALSPLAILSRGYALAWKEPENTLIRKAADVSEGDAVRIQVGRGALGATVTAVEEE